MWEPGLCHLGGGGGVDGSWGVDGSCMGVTLPPYTCIYIYIYIAVLLSARRLTLSDDPGTGGLGDRRSGGQAVGGGAGGLWTGGPGTGSPGTGGPGTVGPEDTGGP